MKRRIIEQVLYKKVKSWIDSITDNNLKDMLWANTIITGGSIASMFLKEKVNDYDVYFRNKATVEAVANYYIKLYQSNSGEGKSMRILTCDSQEYQNVMKDYIEKGYEHKSYKYMNIDEDRVKIITESFNKNKRGDLKDKKYQPVYFSSNAITLTNKIQLIVRFWGEPSKIHENYDFIHCTNYWTSWEKKLVTTIEALESLLTKDLHYVGSKYPICSIIRSKKFVLRGWNCNAGQYLKMTYGVNILDMNNVDVLEDQLVGVDSLYFERLITELRNIKENNGELSQTILMDTIDKIF